MKLFRITLRDTTIYLGEVEIMAEDEVTAREMALRSPRVEWDDGQSDTVVDHIEEILDSDED